MNIIDNNHLLSQQQIKLLVQSASLTFCLGNYSSLDDILNKQNVNVIIEPGIVTRTIPSALEEAEKYWKEEVRRLKDESKEDLREAIKKLDEIGSEKAHWSSMSLRGLYDPCNNEIKLFPEEMLQEYGGTRMDELLVSTLAHETMHAYFNRPGHETFPYVIHVEEPLAEFGMLLYLHQAVNGYYSWAHKDVSNKKTCYRYGAILMNQHLNVGPNSYIRQYLENYKIFLNVGAMINVNSVSSTTTLPYNPLWQDVYKRPPRYFFDQSTNTLGLDGDWGFAQRNTKSPGIYAVADITRHDNLEQIYLGDDFFIDDGCHLDIFSKYNVSVSSANKYFYSKNGVPFDKKNNLPMLDKCGNGLFELSRNGKWGVVDARLNTIVPINYDFIGSFDKNDLIIVEIDNLSGLVNMQGEVQVPLIYDDIKANPEGTYTVKLNGSEYTIDKKGNKI